MKVSVIPIVGIPLTSAIVLNSLNIDNDKHPYAKLVEVYFYAPTPTSSSEQQKIERIKVWIEDLGDFNKFQFYKNNGENKWLSFNKATGEEKKKYQILAEIAKYFFLNQHFLNISKGLALIKDEGNVTVTCSDTCVKKPNCCLKECTNLPEEHKKFFYYLNNLNSAQTGVYLTPIQAHISLGSIKFEELKNQSNQEKQISGSLVYGHVDYYYKTKDSAKLDIPSKDKQFYKLTDSSDSNTSNKKYFANYPTTFSMTLDNEGQIKEGASENDLLKVHKKLSEKKGLDKLLEDKKNLKICCCADEPKPNSFDCLLGSNFVKLEDTLDTIQRWVKDKEPCK